MKKAHLALFPSFICIQIKAITDTAEDETVQSAVGIFLQSGVGRNQSSNHAHDSI